MAFMEEDGTGFLGGIPWHHYGSMLWLKSMEELQLVQEQNRFQKDN